MPTMRRADGGHVLEGHGLAVPRLDAGGERIALVVVAASAAFMLVVASVAAGSAAVASALLVGAAVLAAVLMRRLLRGGVERAAASERILALGAATDGDELAAAIARELGDPSLRVLYREHDSAGLIDAGGRVATVVSSPERRRFGLLPDGLGPTVVIDSVVENVRDRATREAVFGAATLMLEHSRLQALLRRELAEVRESRTRLVRAALDERLQLESKLHDGAQSGMFAAMAEIARARSHIDEGPVLDTFEAASRNLARAVEELRALVKGRIVPSALREAGLAAAIGVATAQFPIDVTVEQTPLADEPTEATEIAAYLCVIDLLQQAATDGAATRARVVLGCADAQLTVTVAHDGQPLTPWAGVVDRVQALGGTIERVDRHASAATPPAASAASAVVVMRMPCE